MSKVTDTVTALAAPVAEKLGLELWDVEYIREAGQWFLRVYIDKDGGVSINDCEALSRAEVLSVEVLEEGHSCRVIVPDSQLSLAIGKEGQNARLAARLTGYKIDIKPESAANE